jgi:L-ribulose-5-phosphate 3-epimerase
MEKGINYWAFPAEADGAPIDVRKAMKRARELGYDCFEPTLEATGAISASTTQREAEAIRKEAEGLGLRLRTLASGLAWGSSPTHPDPEVRAKAVSTYERMLEVAHWLGIETILYLPGMVSALFIPGFPPQPYDAVWGWAEECLRRLLPVAERTRVRIGIENVWNRFLLSPLEMRDFIDSFGTPMVGSYFDVGNIMLYGHPEHWIAILGKRIQAVHLKDFRVSSGNLDGFVDLLSGDVNWKAVMTALSKVGYDGPMTAEIVPGRAGAAEKAIAAMRLIESMKPEATR